MVFFFAMLELPSFSLLYPALSLSARRARTPTQVICLRFGLRTPHVLLLSPLQNAYLPCLLVQCHLQRSAEPGTENSSQPYRGMTFKCKFNLNNREERQRNASVQTCNTILQASQEYSGKVEKLIRFICHRHAREELYLCVGVCVCVCTSSKDRSVYLHYNKPTLMSYDNNISVVLSTIYNCKIV